MSAIGDYVLSVQTALKRGDATEHTHRPAFKLLLETVLEGVTAVNEPRRQAAGAPDFVVDRGSARLGYVEAKDVGKDLDRVLETEQLQRYRASLSNLILTDYLEFRWFVDGELRETVRIADWEGDEIRHTPASDQPLEILLRGFAAAPTATIRSPEELAKRMAALAQHIRHTILLAFNEEEPGIDSRDPLHMQYRSFREVLLADLDPLDFADMYAQTITYGMFAARTSPGFEPPFDRYRAAHLIPRTNPFLRQLFAEMAGPNLDNRVDWIVDDLVNLLNHADIAGILSRFGQRTRQEDPVVHFYETFLAEYDPELRETRGVYYTPEPVVEYITRSIDHLLRAEFGLADGLASTDTVRVREVERRTEKDRKTRDIHRIQILDPATGTGTFLHSVVDAIHQTVAGNGGANSGLWSGYVQTHLLPRLHGFELLMAPYTVAHMKLGLQLAELGYKFDSDERLRVFLTNSLEEAHEFPSLPLFGQFLANETEEAGKVKADAPVMVVLGNPPYSGHSANKGDWITRLLHGPDATHSYFHVDGHELLERQKKWLNDDYVKFIRFAQWRIESTGYGILGFVTNHSYLDNPTFRGMRESLYNTFDLAFLLDLKGDANQGSKDGARDENVFDIQQGVAISIYVKRPKHDQEKRQYFHATLLGERQEKYRTLSASTVESTSWNQLSPTSPYYWFFPRVADLDSEYAAAWSVTDIFPVNGVGFITGRDKFALDANRERLEERVSQLRDSRIPTQELRDKYSLTDTTSWSLERARERLQRDRDWQSAITPCTIRPFDVRFGYLSSAVMERPVWQTQRHLVPPGNMALLTSRKTTNTFQHVFVTDRPAAFNTTGTAGKYGSAYTFPLYVYPAQSGLFGRGTADGRHHNISAELTNQISANLGLEFQPNGRGNLLSTFGPEDVLAYVYSVLHMANYRARYGEYLKRDFPRIPFTSRADLFRSIADIGHRLLSLHLLRDLPPAGGSFPIEGSNIVEEPRFITTEGAPIGRTYINGE